MRILNNKWGSDELGCSGTTMSVYVNQDGSVGWDFNRGNCDSQDKGAQPDYPEIEFGINPFGPNSSLVTSPKYSSTSLLPIQIKDITSANLTVDGLNINLQKGGSWNLNFEFWISQRNPVTDPNPGPYAEVMGFWGWQNGRWPCDTKLGTQTVNAGDKSYNLCHQDDAWAGGKWRYFQFWVNGGPLTSFSGKVNLKAFIDWLFASSYGSAYSKDYWITRVEVGSEIDDETAGSVKIKNLTFEINGQSKSFEIAK
jgi:hypothetical protein